MTFDELEDLHNITHLKNLPSILEHGIVSHERAKKLNHESVAMQEIQDRRAIVVLPNGRRLHSYANLYINARNKMMFKIRDRHKELCVIRIAKGVLELQGVVVTDQNASSDRVRFGGGVDGLKRIDRDYVFAKYWNHPNDQIEHWDMVPRCAPKCWCQTAYRRSSSRDSTFHVTRQRMKSGTSFRTRMS